MATIKRPGDKPEATEEAPEKREVLGYHTIKGGVKFPIVDRYWSKSRRCVVDVYEKSRAVRTTDPDTGTTVMKPGVKTLVSTYCLDPEVQRNAAHKFGVHMDFDIEEHVAKLNLTPQDHVRDDREEI